MGFAESRLRWKGKKSKIIFISQKEVLKNNKLDKIFFAVLRPFYIVMILCCCPKYNIRNRSITPQGIIFYAQSIFGLSVVFILSFYRLFEIYTMSKNNDLDGYVVFTYIVNHVYYTMIYTLVTISSIKMSEQNVKFVLKINDFCKNFKFVNFNEIVLWSWSANIIYLIYFIFYQTIFYIFDVIVQRHITDPIQIIYTMLLSSLDINIMYAICMIKLLRKCLEVWKNQAEDAYENNVGDTEIDADKMLESYLNLIDTYGAFQKLVQGMVL